MKHIHCERRCGYVHYLHVDTPSENKLICFDEGRARDLPTSQRIISSGNNNNDHNNNKKTTVLDKKRAQPLDATMQPRR